MQLGAASSSYHLSHAEYEDLRIVGARGPNHS